MYYAGTVIRVSSLTKIEIGCRLSNPNFETLNMYTLVTFSIGIRMSESHKNNRNIFRLPLNNVVWRFCGTTEAIIKPDRLALPGVRENV